MVGQRRFDYAWYAPLAPSPPRPGVLRASIVTHRTELDFLPVSAHGTNKETSPTHPSLVCLSGYSSPEYGVIILLFFTGSDNVYAWST